VDKNPPPPQRDTFRTSPPLLSAPLFFKDSLPSPPVDKNHGVFDSLLNISPPSLSVHRGDSLPADVKYRISSYFHPFQFSPSPPLARILVFSRVEYTFSPSDNSNPQFFKKAAIFSPIFLLLVQRSLFFFPPNSVSTLSSFSI